MPTQQLDLHSDFEYLTSFLPPNWQSKAKELGALRRCRKVPDAETLLRVLLIHLAEGCSFRETSVRARRGHLIELSDVAIMDRLKSSGEWFRWMNVELMKTWVARSPAAIFGDQWNVRVVDGTRIKEPGPTGSSWCIHYSIDLPSLACDEFMITDQSLSGESFTRFTVRPGDLMIGDRAYGVRPGIFHVVESGGDVLVRFAASNLPLHITPRRRFGLLNRLRKLRGTQLGDWPALLVWKEREVKGRVCAIKKSRQAARQAMKQARQKSVKNGAKIRPETLEAAKYTFIFTTIEPGRMTASSVLEMYRGRWQVELVFKRLKSIMGLGHLRKTDPRSARAWLQGKLLVAFLIEALICRGETFSPWGYPIRETSRPQSLSVARGALHAASGAVRDQSST